MRRTISLLLGTIALFSGSAAHAVCSFGSGTAGEPSLQEIFDDSFGGGVIESNDCIDDSVDSYWTIDSSAEFFLGAEIAGFADDNVFGIYDVSNPDNHLAIFYGHQDSGDWATLSVSAVEGGFEFVVSREKGDKSEVFGSSVFGFYLATPQDHVFYSDTGLNGDQTDHLYVYQSVEEFIEACFEDGGHVLVGAGDHILAWEDLKRGGDGDYQDMVLVASGLMAVPLPAAFWLLLSSLAGLVAARTRRKTIH